MHLCAGIKAGRRTGRCPDPIRTVQKGWKRRSRSSQEIRPGQSVGIFIGPEGGFEEEEVALAMKTGANPVTLGKRILRTETAGLTMLSVLMFHLEG